jgi:Domain of Unknown Function (DUF1206)
MTRTGESSSPKDSVLGGIARMGLIAKGVVYLLFGGLVCYAAVGGARVTDEQGAMSSLFQLPFGKVLLAALAVGLFAYCVGRLHEMIFNPQDHDGFWTTRARPLLSALVYGSLGVEALRMIAGFRGAGEAEGETREQAALVMSLPAGHWLLVTFGAILVVSALSELWQNAAGKKEPEARPPGASMRRWYERLARLGEIARGLIGLVGGAYLIIGGLHRSPGEVRGSRGVLEKIAEQPFGRWLLLLTAVGLVLYGIVQFMEAWYRRNDAR